MEGRPDTMDAFPVGRCPRSFSMLPPCFEGKVNQVPDLLLNSLALLTVRAAGPASLRSCCRQHFLYRTCVGPSLVQLRHDPLRCSVADTPASCSAAVYGRHRLLEASHRRGQVAKLLPVGPKASHCFAWPSTSLRHLWTQGCCCKPR